MTEPVDKQTPEDVVQGSLELLWRVRIILDDLFGMNQDDAQELIDKLRDSGIEFREIEECY